MPRPFLILILGAALLGGLTAACGTQGESSSAATAPPAGHASPKVPAGLPGNWLTFGDNLQHSGLGPARTGITAGNVRSLRLRRITIPGVADSAPVEVGGVRVRGRRHDVVAVTTTYGRTVAVDPQTGKRLWQFVPRGIAKLPSAQVTTSSPAVDPDQRFIYSASANGVIHKLSLTSGRQVWSRSITFDPRHEKIASSLTVSGPYVVAVTGGYIGDAPPYDGHVVTIRRSNGRIAHVWNSECSSRHRLIRAGSCSVTNTNGDNAMWGRAGAVIEPGSRRILVATGNGPFDGRENWGDSVLELSSDAARLEHNWTPVNQSQLDATDTDVGSTFPTLLPAYQGFHLAVQGGKDGRLHLLNLRRLNGTRGRAGGRLGGEVSETSSPGGREVFTAPAAERLGGRVMIFVGDDAGSVGYSLGGGSHPALRRVWTKGTPATSPVLAGGLLYAYDEVDGRLLVRRPETGRQLASLAVGHGHWNSPIVLNGRIVLPTGNYHGAGRTSVIDVYHLPGR